MKKKNGQNGEHFWGNHPVYIIYACTLKAFDCFRFLFRFFLLARADLPIIYIQAIPFHGGGSHDVAYVQRCSEVPLCAELGDCGVDERDRSIKCQPVYLELSSSLLCVRPWDLLSDRGSPKTIQHPRIDTGVWVWWWVLGALEYWLLAPLGRAESSSPFRQKTYMLRRRSLPPIDLHPPPGFSPTGIGIHQLT